MPSKLNVGLVIANVLGCTAFLYLASRYTWAIPEERAAGVYAVSGEPFIWAGIVVPIWGTFALINLIWVLTIVKKRWLPAILWWAVVGMWIVAAVIDNLHH